MSLNFWMIASFIGALIFNYIYWYLFYSVVIYVGEIGSEIGIVLIFFILLGIFFVSVLVQTTNKFIQIIVRKISKKIVCKYNKVVFSKDIRIKKKLFFRDEYVRSYILLLFIMQVER